MNWYGYFTILTQTQPINQLSEKENFSFLRPYKSVQIRTSFIYKNAVTYACLKFISPPINEKMEVKYMPVYKVEICGVNTSKLPLLSNEKDEKEELFKRILDGDMDAREQYIKGNCVLS